MGFLKIQFVAKKLEGDPLETFKNFRKNPTKPKNQKGDPSVSSGFANAGKSFWLKQGFEPETTGFPLNRLVELIKLTKSVSSLVLRKSHYYSLLYLRKRRLKNLRANLIALKLFCNFHIHMFFGKKMFSNINNANC